MKLTDQLKKGAIFLLYYIVGTIVLTLIHNLVFEPGGIEVILVPVFALSLLFYSTVPLTIIGLGSVIITLQRYRK